MESVSRMASACCTLGGRRMHRSVQNLGYEQFFVLTLGIHAYTHAWMNDSKSCSAQDAIATSLHSAPSPRFVRAIISMPVRASVAGFVPTSFADA